MCLLAVHLALANLVPWGPSCGSQKECEAEASGMLALYLDRMTRGEVVWGSFFFFLFRQLCFFLGLQSEGEKTKGSRLFLFRQAKG